MNVHESFDPAAIAVFVAILGILFFWFPKISELFRILKERHVEKFRDMGEPSLFGKKSPKASSALMKFLSNREYRDLNDPELSKVAGALRVFIILYVSIFIVGAGANIYLQLMK